MKNIFIYNYDPRLTLIVSNISKTVSFGTVDTTIGFPSCPLSQLFSLCVLRRSPATSRVPRDCACAEGRCKIEEIKKEFF